jgi:ABC-type glycerol-3-phosphate transport system substrate-binding protein
MRRPGPRSEKGDNDADEKDEVGPHAGGGHSAGCERVHLGRRLVRGRNGRDRGPVTLDFWVFKEIESGAFYDEPVSQFEAANPNIDIELTSYPEENYDIKIDTALAAGQAPDLMLNFGPDYPRQGLLLPLDDELAEEGVDLSTFSEAIMGEGGEFGCGWEGKIYCVGWY